MLLGFHEAESEPREIFGRKGRSRRRSSCQESLTEFHENRIKPETRKEQVNVIKGRRIILEVRIWFLICKLLINDESKDGFFEKISRDKPFSKILQINNDLVSFLLFF